MTTQLLDLWIEARTRFSNLLPSINNEDLIKKLPNTPNSAGFIIRHIGDVEFLFAKNVFGDEALKVSAKTVIAQKDTGEWTDLQSLIQYQQDSFEALKAIVEKQTEADWNSSISTKEFGTKTKVQAFGRIISHTTYHAGQLAMIVKYGI